MMNHRKHFIVVFAIFAVFIFLSLACASSSDVQTPPPEFHVTYEYESDSPAVSVVVNPNWEETGGIAGFSCKFTNHSDGLVKVVWEGSSLYYDGNSSVPFIDGQKYADADKPMVAAIIPRGGFLEKTVFSSEQVYYMSGKYGGWGMLPIEANPVQIIFQIDSENGSEYVVVNVSYDDSKNESNG